MEELVYKIDPEGKYIFIISYVEGERMIEDASLFAEKLREWWESNEPFIIFAPYGNINLRIERVDKDD